MANSWRGHFIGRARVLDWLKLLNFEVTVSSEFFLDTVKTTHGKFIRGGSSFSSTAYAVKAIKRRYNLIPLTPVKEEARLVLINTVNPTANLKHHD